MLGRNDDKNLTVNRELKKNSGSRVIITQSICTSILICKLYF